VIHTLIKNNLIDEFKLHVYPVSLGGGKRLFPEKKDLVALKDFLVNNI